MMKTKAPPDRRKFADERDQIDYLYHKLLYWLYEREDRVRAQLAGHNDLAAIIVRIVIRA